MRSEYPTPPRLSCSHCTRTDSRLIEQPDRLPIVNVFGDMSGCNWLAGLKGWRKLARDVGTQKYLTLGHCLVLLFQEPNDLGRWVSILSLDFLYRIDPLIEG